MDPLNPEQRRRAMQSNKSSGTMIEKLLGSALHKKGMRYRKNNKSITGTPDFSIKKYKIAIFADGDFWHGKDWQKRRNKIGSNAAFWFEKIERNIERDYKVTKKLRNDGWTVLRFWETDIKKNLDAITEFICKKVDEIKNTKTLEKAQRKATRMQKKQQLINNYLSTHSKKLEEKATKYTKEILQYKYPDDEITFQVAEEILKYGTANDEK